GRRDDPRHGHGLRGGDAGRGAARDPLADALHGVHGLARAVPPRCLCRRASVAALLIVRAFGQTRATGLTIAASLAQIGEFSFILAGLRVALGLLPAEGRDLVLAGAILSILLNPFLFGAVERRRSLLAR